MEEKIIKSIKFQYTKGTSFRDPLYSMILVVTVL